MTALAKCDDTEPVRLCSAPDAGGCRLESLGASGGLERVQPIACVHCHLVSLPRRTPGATEARAPTKLETCEANNGL